MSEQENAASLKSIKMTTTLDVPIALGTFEYIAGIDPVETWAPFVSDEVDMEEYDKMRHAHMAIIREKESTREYQDSMKSFMEETINVYQGIMRNDTDVIKPYLSGRSFNFVLGMPRSGGTTLYQAMSDIHGWPWNNLLVSMTHNYMPNGGYVMTYADTEYDMGWRLPWNFNNVVFELCQFLVYINNEAPDSEHVFLKSTALSYATKFLNFIFGGNANYYVTVRHPGAIALTGDKEDVTREDHMQNMLAWSNLYSSILRDCRPMGNLYVAEYGEGLTEFINHKFEEFKVGRRLEESNFFEFEDYDKTFYESDDAKRMFKYVEDTWALFDAKFPTPEKCI
jgi:hypothetical protein